MIPHQLTLNNSGLTIARTPATAPPLGLIVPAKQSILQQVDTTLDSVRNACVTEFPLGVAVHVGGNIYAWDGSAWQDDVNSGPVTGATVIQGEAAIVNPAAYDIGITW